MLACGLQALTPNLLARTIETVEGGGLVILLLKTVTSLKQLYAMSMDVHSRQEKKRGGEKMVVVCVHVVDGSGIWLVFARG